MDLTQTFSLLYLCLYFLIFSSSSSSSSSLSLHLLPIVEQKIQKKYGLRLRFRFLFNCDSSFTFTQLILITKCIAEAQMTTQQDQDHTLPLFSLLLFPNSHLWIPRGCLFDPEGEMRTNQSMAVTLRVTVYLRQIYLHILGCGCCRFLQYGSKWPLHSYVTKGPVITIARGPTRHKAKVRIFHKQARKITSYLSLYPTPMAFKRIHSSSTDLTTVTNNENNNSHNDFNTRVHTHTHTHTHTL